MANIFRKFLKSIGISSADDDFEDDEFYDDSDSEGKNSLMERLNKKEESKKIDKQNENKNTVPQALYKECDDNKYKDIDNEILNLISKIDKVCCKKIVEKDKWKHKVKNILLAERIKKNKDKDYILTIKAAVIFNNTMWNEINILVENIIRFKKGMEKERLYEKIKSIQIESNLTHKEIIRHTNGKELNQSEIEILKTYDNLSSLDLIKKLEADFIYSYTKLEVAYNLIGLLGNNPNILRKLFEYNPSAITNKIFDSLVEVVNITFLN